MRQPAGLRKACSRALALFLYPLALVDLIAVLPYFLSFWAVDMRFLRALRLLRLFRIAKFGRYSETLALFSRVMRHKKEELIITSLLMLILIILSASPCSRCRPAFLVPASARRCGATGRTRSAHIAGSHWSDRRTPAW
ncbi:MAG: hypothetical protein Q8O33_10325 [Pseudomonadota bacterium]|nr:hypothetical protein [Pseudomonadota bacterium]